MKCVCGYEYKENYIDGKKEDNYVVAGDNRVYFNSLIDAAEYVREIKELETCTDNIKKNIHACLVGKRKSCYGYKAINPWEEF